MYQVSKKGRRARVRAATSSSHRWARGGVETQTSKRLQASAQRPGSRSHRERAQNDAVIYSTLGRLAWGSPANSCSAPRVQRAPGVLLPSRDASSDDQKRAELSARKKTARRPCEQVHCRSEHRFFCSAPAAQQAATRAWSKFARGIATAHATRTPDANGADHPRRQRVLAFRAAPPFDPALRRRAGL